MPLAGALLNFMVVAFLNVKAVVSVHVSFAYVATFTSASVGMGMQR